MDGAKTTYKFSSWSPQFGRMAKTNIDRIAKIRKGSLALAQRNRSKIQKKPLPKINFEKSDIGELAEKFKRPSVNMFHSYINEVFGANTYQSASSASSRAASGSTASGSTASSSTASSSNTPAATSSVTAAPVTATTPTPSPSPPPSSPSY